MSQYTSGPWFFSHVDDFGDHNIVTGDQMDSRAIAAVVSNMRPPLEVAANARLIAAAPEMLAELEWIAAFAEMRSQDDSKVFARVNRGALRNIAQRCRDMADKAGGA